MPKLVGHDLVYKELIRLFKNNILPKKILISGRSGIGKSLLVDKFINYMINNIMSYLMLYTVNQKLLSKVVLKMD